MREMEILQQNNSPVSLATHKPKPNSCPLFSSKMHSVIPERLVMFSKGPLKLCKNLCFQCALPLNKMSSFALKSHPFIPQNLLSPKILRALLREIYIAYYWEMHL